MIVTRHKKSSGLYLVYCTGKQKSKCENTEMWEPSVIYKRLPWELKPDDDTSEVYSKPVSMFRDEFELVGYSEFIEITGTAFQEGYPIFGGKFESIFKREQ